MILKFLVVFYFVVPVFGKNYYCKTNDDCNVDKGIICENGLCSCGPWKVFSTDKEKCLDIAPTIGSPCEDSTQCTALISGPSICDNREMCACAEGHVYYNNRCMRYSGYNEACGDDVPCFDGVDLFALTCKDKKCSCSDGYYTRGVGCRPSAKANDGNCFFDIDCENTDQSCKFTLTNWGPIGSCTDVPTTVCLSDKHCMSISNSFCDKNKLKCRCKNGFDYDKTKNLCASEKPTEKIMLKNNEKLKEIPVIDIQCDDDKTCKRISNSFCHSYRKKCTCKDGYIFSKSTGHCVQALGSKCTTESDCGVRYSICENGLCQCPKFFIYSPYANKCYKPTREFNLHSCGADENCYSFGPYSSCVRANEKSITSTCICKSSSKYNSTLNYCEPVITGQQCKNDCKHKPHSKCIGLECKCEEHYYDNGLKCLPDLGYSCSDRENDCQIPNAECVIVGNTNICQCEEGYIQNDVRECLKVITTPEEECDSDKQCSNYLDDGGICQNKTCTCREGYAFDDQLNKCELIRIFGDACSTRRECNVIGNWDHVSCRNGVCVCEYGYKYSEEIKNCISGANTIIQSALLIVFFLLTTVLF